MNKDVIEILLVITAVLLGVVNILTFTISIGIKGITLIHPAWNHPLIVPIVVVI